MPQIEKRPGIFSTRLPLPEVASFPFSTSTGSNPDKTKAGYNPDKKTPIRNNEPSPNQNPDFANNEKLRCCPETALKPGMARTTMMSASTKAMTV